MAGGRGRTSGNGVPKGPGRYAVDNLPYALTGALGAWMLLEVHWVAAIVQVAASVLGPLWIMLKVCPNCLLYGSSACPSGFGLASARMTGRGDPDHFREVFGYHITAVAPMWFIPVAGVVYMLVVGINVPWLLFLVFVLVAFVGVPIKSRYITCPKCPKRNDCPWGARAALPRTGR
jgi:hypothetical protein